MKYRDIFTKLNSEISGARIMAVSKTRSLEEVKEAYSDGFRLFGENHVQEIIEKFSEWKPKDLELHMIGHLQTNKVAKVVPIADMIESVDSLHLLEKIDSCAAKKGKTMPVLLEFNTSGEDNKSGFVCEEDLFECLESAKTLKNVSIRGLMTVGPLDSSQTKKAFEHLADLYKRCCEKYPVFPFEELSMGMSSDYRIGIECGSTIVRIGTAVFGERYYG